MSGITTSELAPTGSTGNNTHKAITFSPHVDQVGLEFEITAVGAGPTVTFKMQGSFDSNDVKDADSKWFDIAMQPSDTAGNTEVTTVAKTAIGVYAYFLRLENRFAQKLRLVTTLNTNVTYRARAALRDSH